MDISTLLILAGIGVVAFLQLKPKKDDSSGELRTLTEEKVKIESELTQAKELLLASEEAKRQLDKEVSELSGKGKEMFAQSTKMEANLQQLSVQRDDLQKKVNAFEEREERNRLEMDRKTEQLDEAKKSFEDEKLRVRREDEERQQQELEERDRLWGEHEQQVIARLQDLCAQPELSFTLFENTNLPEEFDGSFKPDALIEFLGQYVIFDAKVSRSDNFQKYMTEQARKTAQKAKKKNNIASTIFLVVPTEAISELKRTHFFEEGFTIFVISPEALPPILASLKKITTYEFADQFDPAEREDIINHIAKLDYHLSARNTFDLLLAKAGTDLLEQRGNLKPELADAIAMQTEKMKFPSLKPSDCKKLVSNIIERQAVIDELTEPKAAIKKEDVQEMENLIS